jgi:hypothetical protein
LVEEDVLRDRHQRNERQFLMDDDDAELLGIVDVAEAPLLAPEADLALVGTVRIDPAEHLHQGRLASAVLADEGVDLTRRTAKLTSEAPSPPKLLVMPRISRITFRSSSMILPKKRVPRRIPPPDQKLT